MWLWRTKGRDFRVGHALRRRSSGGVTETTVGRGYGEPRGGASRKPRYAGVDWTVVLVSSEQSPFLYRPSLEPATRMGRKVTVATCALNQWALDFEGNFQRILKSESWGGGRQEEVKVHNE